MDLSDPTTAALLVADALGRAGHPHAVYGGLALAAYGEPRETRDADLAVIDLTPDEVRRVLAAAGIETMVVFEGVRMGGLDVSRLTLLDAPGHTGLNTLDLVRPRSARYRREAVSRAISVPVRGRDVRVVTPEDFVVFKALSTRDRDVEDAASVLRRDGPRLDRALIEREVSALASEIPDFDVRSNLARILARAEEGPVPG